jgi:hypothetical protein
MFDFNQLTHLQLNPLLFSSPSIESISNLKTLAELTLIFDHSDNVSILSDCWDNVRILSKALSKTHVQVIQIESRSFISWSKVILILNEVQL